MKNDLYLLLLFITCFVSFESKVFASVIIVPSDSEVKILINKETGSLLQLPSSVRTITPSRYFQISDVASDVDAATGRKMDVRLFQVTSLSGSQADNVTFVLGNGRAVKMQLIPSDSAEKHYDVVFPSASKKAKSTNFLQAELAMMVAMIRDEGGDFARQVKDSSVSISGYVGASANLVRIFAGNSLTGYAFEICNNSSDPLSVDVSRLSLSHKDAVSEKAILLHAEKEKLEPCGLIAKPECKTRIFVVARADQTFTRGGLGLQQKASGDGSDFIHSQFPFVRDAAESGGGAQ